MSAPPLIMIVVGTREEVQRAALEKGEITQETGVVCDEISRPVVGRMKPRLSPASAASGSRMTSPTRKEVTPIRVASAALAVAATLAPTGHIAPAHKRHHRKHHRHHHRHHVHYWANSTAYNECDGSASAVADPYAHGRIHFGWVANNSLPFGTTLRMDRPVFGKRYFVVHDRIGSGSELDFYMSCGQLNAWGRREVGFVVWHYGRGR